MNNQPSKFHNNILYKFNNRVVRMVKFGALTSEVRHHDEKMTVGTSELFTATSDECKAYLKKPVK